MKTHELLITDDIFSGLRQDFNMMLRKTLHTMQSKGSDVGEVNLKLKIFLSHELQETENIVFGKERKEYINPKFEHKVTSVIQMKGEVAGTIEGKYELTSNNGQYCIQEIENPQVSLFDDDSELWLYCGFITGGDVYGKKRACKGYRMGYV